MADKVCPLLTFDMSDPQACIEHRCAFYTQLQGQHPQTGEMLSEWGCAIAWLPVLAIEGSQQQRQTGAAVESFRNEMVKDGERTREMFTGLAGQARLRNEQ